MPAKNSIVKYSNRYNSITKKGYKNYMNSYPASKMTYQDFKYILELVLNEIVDTLVSDNSGIKLPIGYLVINQYKPTRKLKNKRLSKELGYDVFYQNLHSFGNVCSVKWFAFNSAVTDKMFTCYKFEACRDLNRNKLKPAIEKGIQFCKWNKNDFMNYTKIDRFLNKD